MVDLSNQDCCPLQDKIISTTDHWSVVTIILSIKEKYTFVKDITEVIKFFQVWTNTCIYQTKCCTSLLALFQFLTFQTQRKIPNGHILVKWQNWSNTDSVSSSWTSLCYCGPFRIWSWNTITCHSTGWRQEMGPKWTWVHPQCYQFIPQMSACTRVHTSQDNWGLS